MLILPPLSPSLLSLPQIPVFFVITKVDIAPEHILKQTVQVQWLNHGSAGLWRHVAPITPLPPQADFEFSWAVLPFLSPSLALEPPLTRPCHSSEPGHHPEEARCEEEAVPGPQRRRRAALCTQHEHRQPGTHLPHLGSHRWAGLVSCV